MALLPGGGEIWIVVLAIVLLFGASAIPKLARGIGRAQGEFQKARGEFEAEVKAGKTEAASAPTAASPPVAATTAAPAIVDEEEKPATE